MSLQKSSYDYEEVDDLLAEALSDLDETRRNRAAIILGERGDARAANALIPLLAQERWAKKAEEALWEIGAGSTGPLIAALSSSDAEIGEKAADLLDYIGEIGAEEVDLLIATLSSPDPDVREKATLMLGDTKDAKAVGVLMNLLVDEDDNIRLAASISLNTLKDPHAIPVLVSFLDDPRFDFRFNAFWELAKIGYFQEHIEALEALTQDLDERIRMFATSLLESMKKQG